MKFPHIRLDVFENLSIFEIDEWVNSGKSAVDD